MNWMSWKILELIEIIDHWTIDINLNGKYFIFNSI